ncbi:uncharacterized protein LOC142329049 isoform X2 [Lycorma delicatula]|uniref:uncharacterized protein LOC142329049 isoform X2 n=1 Tax=Lycorma delicatula TaxID=130591 RepID=UPI003F515C2C
MSLSSSSNNSTNVSKRFKSSNIVDASVLHKISNQIMDLQTMFSSRISILEHKLDLLVTCYTGLMERLESDDINTCGNNTNSNMKSTLIRSTSTCDDDEDDDDFGDNDNNLKEHKCSKEAVHKLSNIENMIEKIISYANTSVDTVQNGKKSEDSSLLTVLLPQMKPKVETQVGIDSNMQVITLNSETDFPDGSWLGDENNPEARVRVPITPAQLLHINTHCSTPGKMAIVLVDYLFPKEVLATSNLSGKGRHCKKQLDPLMIYGIRSHLLYKFKITEKDWYRIKQNIDSKCRTAWKKKVRGMLLGENKNPMLNSRTDEVQNGGHNSKPFILSTNSLSSEEVTEDSDSGSQMFSVEDMDSYTLSGCGDEQTLTIVTENGEVSIPISTEDSLGSDSQFISQDHLDHDKKFISS